MGLCKDYVGIISKRKLRTVFGGLGFWGQGFGCGVDKPETAWGLGKVCQVKEAEGRHRVASETEFRVDVVRCRDLGLRIWGVVFCGFRVQALWLRRSSYKGEEAGDPG